MPTSSVSCDLTWRKILSGDPVKTQLYLADLKVTLQLNAWPTKHEEAIFTLARVEFPSDGKGATVPIGTQLLVRLSEPGHGFQVSETAAAKLTPIHVELTVEPVLLKPQGQNAPPYRYIVSPDLVK